MTARHLRAGNFFASTPRLHELSGSDPQAMEALCRNVVLKRKLAGWLFKEPGTGQPLRLDLSFKEVLLEPCVYGFHRRSSVPRKDLRVSSI
jgi:hypothetical protein